MDRRIFAAVVSLIFALICASGISPQMHAQDGKTPYPSMAPLDQYLMDRNAEIALAQSAAPDFISRDATVIVLGRHGYETAVEGKNGFVCAVERSWMNPFDHPEFWNPKVRGPLCSNPAAALSVLPITYLRTKMVLAGLSKTEMIDRTKAAYATKELPALEPGAMCFMMGKQGYLTDDSVTGDGAHSIAHLMFYTPHMEGATWRAAFQGNPEPITVFIILTGKWSDKTPAPVM